MFFRSIVPMEARDNILLEALTQSEEFKACIVANSVTHRRPMGDETITECVARVAVMPGIYIMAKEPIAPGYRFSGLPVQFDVI